MKSEITVLVFLWKWKFATTAVLCFRFYPTLTPHSGYKKLLRLKKLGLIQFTADPLAENFFWALTKKGFYAIKHLLPVLEDDGYRSEHMAHDCLVASFHLGDWLMGMPKGALTFSEQQLRRYFVKDYPSWLPQDRSHRADGYSYVQGMSVAFEVELNKKPDSCYYAVSQFYDTHDNVGKILWLVPTPTMAASLQSCFVRASCRKIEAHNFVLLPHFEKLGWAARVSYGAESGKPVAEILGTNVGQNRDESPNDLFTFRKKKATILEDWHFPRKALKLN
jgi:hypothetical protein